MSRLNSRPICKPDLHIISLSLNPSPSRIFLSFSHDVRSSLARSRLSRSLLSSRHGTRSISLFLRLDLAFEDPTDRSLSRSFSSRGRAWWISLSLAPDQALSHDLRKVMKFMIFALEHEFYAILMFLDFARFFSLSRIYL